jgi:hypothetical protein
MKRLFHDFLVFLPLGICSLFIALNATGFCFKEFRYLSYDEKIRIVFKSHNYYPFVRINDESFKKIPYKSFEEFTKENPNCCNINLHEGNDLPPPNFWDRIIGYHSSETITMNYKDRFLDKSGHSRVVRYKSINVLTNCGQVKY